MSRESMRHVLTATLTEVGVAVPPGATVENLVGAAAEQLIRLGRDRSGYQSRERVRQARLRETLRKMGRDPGAHAMVDDMIEDLMRVAERRLV